MTRPMTLIKKYKFLAIIISVIVIVMVFATQMFLEKEKQREEAEEKQREEAEIFANLSAEELYDLSQEASRDRSVGGVLQTRHYYEAAANKGHTDSMYYLAESYFWDKSPIDRKIERKKSAYWHRKAMENGHPVAALKLATFYCGGFNVDNPIREDIDECYKLLWIAVLLGVRNPEEELEAYKEDMPISETKQKEAKNKATIAVEKIRKKIK